MIPRPALVVLSLYPMHTLRALALLALLGLPSLADDAPGHSLHGEAFDEGPRQAAVLMAGMPKIDFPITTRIPEAQKFFTQGVAQQHGFWYFEAERSHRQASALEPDAAMLQLIERVRKPFQAQLSTPLALTQSLLYRRGNFNGSFDQLILDGLMAEKEAEIAFSPGFRWGASLLSGDTITLEDLMNQTAITYPATTLTPMSGQTIKTVLEDVADNLFNPDPYYQQGGDMVRVAGMQYSIEPGAASGQRISNMRLKGQAMQADKIYKVAGWASVNEDVKNAGGEPIWDLMSRYLSHQKVVDIKSLNTPEIIGAQVRA